MTPENNAELHRRTVTEMAITRILLTCLVRQVADPKVLQADFDQSVDEQRSLGELNSGGKPDL